MHANAYYPYHIHLIQKMTVTKLAKFGLYFVMNILQKTDMFYLEAE